MLGWLRNLLKSRTKPIRAAYDNAQTTQENIKLWSYADGLSARAANSLETRTTLRNRSRYEIANSSYLLGIIRTSANDLIGTGPTLQVTTGSKDADRQIESAFSQWSEAVGLTEKLRTQALAKRGDGEGFLVLRTNDKLDSPVQLYPLDIECDQITTPFPDFTGRQPVDGMVIDGLGNPVAYHVLKQHPGDYEFGNSAAKDTVPARFVLHWFRKDRPGQLRGIPETTPSLELFGEMRRYRRAVLGAAEVAASFAAFVKSQLPPNEEEEAQGNPFDVLQIERNVMPFLPPGMDIAQLKSEQPTTTFDMFQEKLLAEACRCLNIPLNIALGTSQKFNFSSARLDHLNYYSGLRIERRQCECTVLDPLFRAWLDEAVMIPGLLPNGIDIANLEYAWHWPGFPYMDPLVDAQADTERLTINRTKTYRQHFAEQGKDWRDEFEQLAEEKKEMDRLGLTPAEVDPNPQGANEPEEANAA